MRLRMPLSRLPLQFLHASISVTMVTGLTFALFHPTPAHADVATKGGEKPKKDPEDKKKKDKKIDFLPEALPAATSFVAGQSVDIELTASVGSLRQMEFVIRQAPLSGTLSAIRAHPRDTNKAVVTYTHRAPDAPLADGFTYACRLEGASWSAPASVTLTGARMEPRIEVVNAPQFGRVFLGGEVSSRVIIRNSGAADFSTTLKWPEPFFGPPTLSVPRGGSLEFQVFARPTRTGEFRHDLPLQPGLNSARAIFYVECLQAFSVSPGQLSLVLDEKTGERSAVLALSNSRPHPVRVIMKHPDRLHAPEEMEVAAGSRSDLRIAIPAGDVEGFKDELVIVAGENVIRVPVEARPKPAVLQVLVPASLSLDFGAVMQRNPASREIVLSNAGGEPLIVEARARPPYALEGQFKSLRVEPRAQTRFKVVLQTEQLGSCPGELELSSSSVRMLIALSADVQESRLPASMAASDPAPVAPTLAPIIPSAVVDAGDPDSDRTPDLFAGRHRLQSLFMTYVSTRGMPIPKSQINPYLERVTSMEVISISRDEAVIAWPEPTVPPSGWVLEMGTQVLDPKTELFIKQWTRHREWELIDVASDKVGMRVHGLQPSTVYELRVMGIDREGKIAEPETSIFLETEPPWRLSPWFWRILILVVLGFVGRFLYRLRQGSGGGGFGEELAV